MGIILFSSLNQAGTAWLRAAVLDDPREFFFFRLDEVGVGWPIPSLLRYSAETIKQEKSVLLELGICGPAIPLCIESQGIFYFHVFYFRISLQVL